MQKKNIYIYIYSHFAPNWPFSKIGSLITSQYLFSMLCVYIYYTNLTVVRESVCLSVCDREVNGSNSNRAKMFSFSASLDLDVTTGSPRCRPGDGERAIFRRRRCPRMLHRRRRFCSKRLFFGALASEAVRQLSSFSA